MIECVANAVDERIVQLFARAEKFQHADDVALHHNGQCKGRTQIRRHCGFAAQGVGLIGDAAVPGEVGIGPGAREQIAAVARYTRFFGDIDQRLCARHGPDFAADKAVVARVTHPACAIAPFQWAAYRFKQGRHGLRQARAAGQDAHDVALHLQLHLCLGFGSDIAAGATVAEECTAAINHRYTAHAAVAQAPAGVDAAHYKMVKRLTRVHAGLERLPLCGRHAGGGYLPGRLAAQI